MTVSNQAIKCIYQGNGVNIKWGFPFPVIAPEDITVYITSALGQETRIYNGYTVDQEDSAIIYPAEGTELLPLPEGWKITLVRQTPMTQEINLTQQGALDPCALEKAYDKTTMILQELAQSLGRIIQVPQSDEGAVSAADFLAEVRSLHAKTDILQKKVLSLTELSKDLANADEDVSVNLDSILKDAENLTQGEIV